MQAAFPLLMAWLHKKKKLTPEMLADPEAAQFIEQMTAGFNAAVDYSIKERPLDDISRRRLQESNYIFSGIKTFHELNEAFPSLLDEEGKPKPFKRFLKDVQKINNTYNGSYLRTEYNFARNASLMAAKWKEFEADGDRYNLQYRTAGDERVRASHQRLDKITLPITSRFWDDYLPPNGYGCRCTVVQVRKGKYPLSDEREALNLASQATAGKHQEMMKFNPGKEMTTFPAYNAYTRSKCKNCKNRPGNISLAADIPDNELCKACRLLKEELKTRRKKQVTQKEFNELKKKALQWADKNLETIKLTNSAGVQAKRTYIDSSDGHKIGVGKTFFTEMMHKNKNNKELPDVVEAATLFKEWIPNAVCKPDLEPGRDHDFKFSVYTVEWNGRNIEFKCKITDGELIYNMRFIK